MSLHLNRQCQRAQNTDTVVNPPFSGQPGIWFLVTGKANQVAHRVGGVASMPDLPTRQTLFAILLHEGVEPAEIHRFCIGHKRIPTRPERENRRITRTKEPCHRSILSECERLHRQPMTASAVHSGSARTIRSLGTRDRDSCGKVT